MHTGVMGVASLQRRDLQRVLLTAMLVGLLVIAGGLGLIAWATTSVDTVERAKEEALVQRRLERSLQQLVEDVNSASIWNDSVQALAGQPDLEWLQVNFGDYYADYMGHALTLTWDGSGRLVHASRDSEAVAPSSEAAFAAAVQPLVEEVRLASREPARRRAVGFDAVANRQAVVRVGSETWLVAVSTIVREDLNAPRLSTDPVVVSGKPIGTLLTSLNQDLAIDGARFLPAPGKGQASIPVEDRSGAALGVVSWTPDRPGRGLLGDALPVMAGVLLLLAIGAIALFVWLDRVARELTRNEIALTEARDRAEAANVAKSRFLANMSHELRTPLNGVVGMSEIMAGGELSPIQRGNLDILRSSAGDLTHMIEHLLQITRLERDEVTVTPAAFDPAAVIRGAVDRHREMAAAKGLSLTRTLDPLGVRIGDQAHLDQVLGYLIDNALTYTEKGGVTVTGRATQDGVRIAVVDTGIGIRPDLKPRLFDVFVQGDDSLTKRFDGVGLGLSICRNLVEAMGGRISVESEEGRGSTFTVDLPLPVADAEARQAAA